MGIWIWAAKKWGFSLRVSTVRAHLYLGAWVFLYLRGSCSWRSDLGSCSWSFGLACETSGDTSSDRSVVTWSIPWGVGSACVIGSAEKFCVVDMSNVSVTLWIGVLGQMVSVVDLKFCELIRSATWSANEIWRLSIATMNAPVFTWLVWIDSHCLPDDCGGHCALVMYLRCSIERCTIGGRSSSRMHERCSVDICEFFSTLWMWFVYENHLRVIWYLRISY